MFPPSLPAVPGVSSLLLDLFLSVALPRRPPPRFVARSIRSKRGVWPVDIVEPHPRTLFISSSAEDECQESIFFASRPSVLFPPPPPLFLSDVISRSPSVLVIPTQIPGPPDRFSTPRSSFSFPLPAPVLLRYEEANDEPRDRIVEERWCHFLNLDTFRDLSGSIDRVPKGRETGSEI